MCVCVVVWVVLGVGARCVCGCGGGVVVVVVVEGGEGRTPPRAVTCSCRGMEAGVVLCLHPRVGSPVCIICVLSERFMVYGSVHHIQQVNI